VKREWSRPDGWHVCKRLERKARPAGRIVRVLEQEAQADGLSTIDELAARSA